MNKVSYNIEFAHIYADEGFNEEQRKSIDVAKKIISKIREKGNTYCCTILIDDYHPTFSSLDVEKLIARIKSVGFPVDHVGFEGKLVGEGNKLLENIPEEMKKTEIFHKPEKKVVCLVEKGEKIGLEDKFEFCNRHTCALLSATWSLIRLGKLNHSNIGIISKTEKPFIAHKIITILPKTFEHTEQKVIEIIKESNFSHDVNNISYEFFE